jgi:hypothetical protein
VHPEVAELQGKLKEILYDCAIDVRATKAALYLSDGNGRFELITEYGFRGSAKGLLDRNDPIVDRCGRGRTAFFLNGLNVEPRFAERLYESGSDRLLAAPVYQRGQLVGVIDSRDKAGKSAFENADLPKAQRISDRVASLFANKNPFNLRFITVSETPYPTPATPATPAASAPPIAAAAPARAPVAPSPPAPPQPEPARPAAGRIADLILQARAASDHLAMPLGPETLAESEIAAARDVLRAMLLIPGVTLASLSAFGHGGGVQEIAAKSSVTPDALNVLESKLHAWLTKRGERSERLRNNVVASNTSAPPVTPEQLQKVFTAPITANAMRGLYLTVAFEAAPDSLAHDLLGVFHAQLQTAIEHSILRGNAPALRVRIAHKIVEPDFAQFPELRKHIDAVVARTDAFSAFLRLPAADAENARLTAMVHDAGMRLLEYDRLYRKHDLTQDEMAILREHPAVGAALVEPLLGPEVAQLVLCHHERADGRGYPNEMPANEVPPIARMVQICDAFETMIAGSYNAPQPRDAALAAIARNAGSQFDADLARRFAEMARR